MKKRILGIPYRRFKLYCLLMAIGIFLSAVFIILGEKYQNSLISYSLGFSSSMIVTVLFAYLIDYMGQKELRDIEKIKRMVYIQPILNKITGLYYRIVNLNSKEGRIKDKEYNFNDFEEFYKLTFDDYCRYLDVLVNETNRTPENINNAFNIKNSIERWCLKEIINSIESIINNKMVLKIESLFSELELLMFEELKEISKNLYLPYLDESIDKNIGILYLNWPKEGVNEIVKNNYKSQIKAFIQQLKDLAGVFEEFKSILDVKLKIPTFNSGDN